MKVHRAAVLAAFALMACAGDGPEPRVDQPFSPTVADSPLAEVQSPTPEPTQTTTPTQTPLMPMGVERAFPNLSFDRMVAMAYPEDGTNRLFLVLQEGRILVFANEPNVASVDTFLDIGDRVSRRRNEEGLLGLAFDPDYSQSGYFYIYYSASGPRRSVVSRFSVGRDDVNAADPSSEQIIREVSQPYSNHNGGSSSSAPAAIST